jgi:hypothetical protein
MTWKKEWATFSHYWVSTKGSEAFVLQDQSVMSKRSGEWWFGIDAVKGGRSFKKYFPSERKALDYANKWMREHPSR